MVLGKAGHFQFLDSQSMLQRTICAVGPIQDASVRSVAQVWRLLQLLTGFTFIFDSFPLMAAMPSGSSLNRAPPTFDRVHLCNGINGSCAWH